MTVTIASFKNIMESWPWPDNLESKQPSGKMSSVFILKTPSNYEARSNLIKAHRLEPWICSLINSKPPSALWRSSAAAGAHTIGLAHCSAFSNRLSPTLDSTLASPLAQSLLTLCPSGSNNTTNLDVTTPTKFDAAYFRNLQEGLGLLTSDAEFQSDGSTSGFVSANTNFNTFAANFISSMIAMGNVEVLTGTAGQIRTNCHAFNS